MASRRMRAHTAAWSGLVSLGTPGHGSELAHGLAQEERRLFSPTLTYATAQVSV